MQFIISDDQLYASGVSNLARLQNGQTRSKIGPNSGPIWQMMTTQPSAHQVVLHMIKKSEGNSFTAMEILQLFAFWQNVITHTWFMSQIKWRNAKCFQKSTFEKIPTGTYPLTKHPIGHWTTGQCGTHREWGKLPGYFVIYNSGRLKKQIIILFLEGSSFGPALLFVPMRHSRTTSLIVLIMIFVQGTTCMLESIFWRKGKCFHIIPAFKKQGNMEYKIILSEWYRSWQRLNLFENIWLKNVAGKEDRRGDWCWIIRLG